MLAGAVAVSGQAPSTADALYRALQAGRYDEATPQIAQLLQQPPPPGSRVESSAPTPVELALLAALLSGSWAPVAALVPEQLPARDAEAYWYLRGVQAARAAWPGGREDALAMARESAERLSALASLSGAWSRGELRRVSVLAAIAGAQEEREELTLLLAHGDQLESRLRAIGLRGEVVLPFDELAGDLWQQIHRFEDAKRRYERVVHEWPERTRAWLGLARAARELAATTDARAAARQVLLRWADSRALEAVEAEMRQIADGPDPRR